jgi:hypothetical protein
MDEPHLRDSNQSVDTILQILLYYYIGAELLPVPSISRKSGDGGTVPCPIPAEKIP